MSLLSITHIKKSYSTVDGQTLPVLKDITASFDTGEFVSIVGESGGGKSTLMNIIAGLDSHFSGDVQVNHQSLRAMSEHQRDRYRRENIGFIFQSFNLISHLTVLENVLVSLEMTNLSRKQQHARAEHLLTQVGLHDRAKVYPNQLSGGQKQRVAIARALASDPEIIIADEPTGALDEQNTQDILHLLDQISASGKLVIAVTHSQIVADHGTRVLHLENGQLVHDTQLKPINSLKQKTEKLATHRLGIRATFLMALKHMQRNLGTNLLITFGGAIGIFSVVVMLALGRGVSGYMHHEISGNLNPTTVEVTHKVKNGNSAAVQMTAHDMKTLSNLPHVTHVEKGYFMPSVQIQYHGQQVTTSYSQTYNKTFLSKNLISGHNPTGNNEIILSRDVAKKYNRHHYQQLLNHQVTIYVNAVDTQQKPVVLSHNMKVVGFTKSSNTAVVSWATIDNMAKAQRIKLQPTFLAVTTDRLSHVKPLQSKIKKLHYNLTGVDAYIDTIDRYVCLASYVLAGIAAISLLVSAIMIIVVLYISVGTRTKEIGILRALGVQKADIRSLFVSEALILGIVYSLLGLLLAKGLSISINSAAHSFIHYPIMQVAPAFALFALATGIVISLIAAWAPAHKAAKLDPVEALSYE
ncbi:ABC transporter ATP-binding protein/permease [Furfurilactobacillus rossiae]|uniref:Phosphonate-transporting ATPase n=1 Tax=Furfurilactobacillus rossiae DSM 15814 TaxID=1114972 RepID=A0A0R1RJL2_9LACO|nr:ABC transporter ATP-binding protein/permease [Furfurilactobacillus rossiae]KRL54389.1 phosphonate-transporting ATPase [Furfurilactobacillus rossiae DSM 15814]QFR66886.1 ATP-binding cassette domain-containing protein [Furfurilactobacillus rossiae]QLE62379.1 drug ABC exporter ATP-binding and membrane-spanning-permease subunits [Furfurilactobacillus rossiae]